MLDPACMVTPDPLEADCARVLGFRIGADPSYCSAAAREFLALWRFLNQADEGKDAQLDEAANIGESFERARCERIVRDRMEWWIENNNTFPEMPIVCRELLAIAYTISNPLEPEKKAS